MVDDRCDHIQGVPVTCKIYSFVGLMIQCFCMLGVLGNSKLDYNLVNVDSIPNKIRIMTVFLLYSLTLVECENIY